MKCKSWAVICVLGLVIAIMTACAPEEPIDMETLMKKPQTYVGSNTCKLCHLEHYDSWKMTLHSRMLQDAQANQDVIIAVLDETKIREDLKKQADTLKVPVDQIYIPRMDEIKYTQGSQWKQQFIVEKGGELLIAPVQYNAETHEWYAYHEEDWEKRPYLTNCAGCHATGVDLGKKTLSEPGVACESCHGKGSWHAALPKTAVFEKRQTIVNPAKLTMGVAVQICGSCHKRGEATMPKGAGWPVGYEAGKALEAYFYSPPYGEGDPKEYYAEWFSKGHHQQYSDWEQSKHYKEGVTCTSCHYVHQIGIPPTRSQTYAAGSQQCFECHVILNKAAGHAIHSFANCIGCHMPRVAKSEESGIVHSHVFAALLPIDTIKNPEIPNSCQTCHKHKDADLKKLQSDAFPGSMDQMGGEGFGGGTKEGF
ncbi:MAG: multiheme c-type cytochrome [Desulfobacteraceae bacterium]|jgi:hypothetical protein